MGCTTAIYLSFFPQVFFHLNSVLSSITGDALKNYYTFGYHLKNDLNVLHFSGMNFPYGEHVIYTDGQPLISNFLKLLPFTQGYFVGIIHALLFLSYIVSPVILFRILCYLEIDRFVAFFSALAIVMLSPQFGKINGGHHALAYGCVVPLSMLLVLNFVRNRSVMRLWLLISYSTLLFLIHPYLGFGAAVFSMLSLLVYAFISFRNSRNYRLIFQSLAAGIIPVSAFKIFMLATDTHPGRTVEPHGNYTLVENIQSLFAPDFGPFQELLENIFPGKVAHLEGHSYLGFFIICLVLLLPFALLRFKKIKTGKEIIAFTAASLFLLFISFGWHNSLLDLLSIKHSPFGQFRAVCRFAWFFYYAFPVFLIVLFYNAFKNTVNHLKFRIATRTLSVFFLLLNLTEAGFLFGKMTSGNFWKHRNFLNIHNLNPEEIKILDYIKRSGHQAIIPLPVFHVGSEMYDRVGADNSMIPSILYSYHTGMPILGSWLSRTSIPETENSLQLLNAYHKKQPAAKFMSSAPFLVIRTTDHMLPDENRLIKKVKFDFNSDSLSFGTISRAALFKEVKDEKCVIIARAQKADSGNVTFIPSENRKPFLPANFIDYETIYTLVPDAVDPGNYIASFHFYYDEKIYKALACNLIVATTREKKYEWKYLFAMSVISGFYPGYGVVENRITIEKNCRYDFILKGNIRHGYHISHFMLRPEHTSVITGDGESRATNNFPPG
jgi:hypothetical protein